MTGRARGWLVWLWVAALVVAFAVVARGGAQGGALDPNGTAPQGAKALVLLLRQYGAEVTVDAGTPAPGVATAFVLRDQLDQGRRAAVSAWVRSGGRLVVADPRSPLQVGAATSVGAGFTASALHPSGGCTLPGLGSVQQLDVGASLLLRAPAGVPVMTCFAYPLGGGRQAAFLVSEAVGRGSVVGLGGAGLWTNQRLDHADNAALAIALLAPTGAPRVEVLVASRAGSGSRSLLDLLSPRLKWALFELAVAFALLVWWRARRFGRPITEAGPVQLAGSEIVVAVGDLMARGGNRQAAAGQLRDGARERLAASLGLSANASPSTVADAVADRVGIPRDRTLGLIGEGAVPDDRALVRLAQSLGDLSEEVAHGGAVARR